MYELEIRPSLDKKFNKLSKRDREILRAINEKLKAIVENPYHYKPLKAPMQHMRRVHILKNFVLIFSIDEKRKTVILEEFAHHDEAYH